MDSLAPQVLARLPLAEAVLTTWRFVANDAILDAIFEAHRGRCYDKDITFPTLVRLIHDVLVGASPSAHRRFTQAVNCDELPASIQAAYAKLGRLPLTVSMAFLADCTDRLGQLIPAKTTHNLPSCFGRWEVVVLDGKAIKKVAKRLAPARGKAGGVLGGRALVAQAMHCGLVQAMHADCDGEANDVRFVPQLVPEVRKRTDRPVLWVADRQFGFPEVLGHLATEGEAFVVRYHGNVVFTPDPTRSVRTGRDTRGREYREEWGWLGGEKNPHRRYVRRITLDRPGEAAVIVVTSLVDANEYPATEVLELYLARWGIERVFQQVTEVFGLAGLIGCTPQATVFQFAFCTLLYNMTQVIRAWVAGAGEREVEEVSSEKLFTDVTAELVSWRTLVSVEETVECVAVVSDALSTRSRLEKLLGSQWRADWAKAPPKKRVAQPKRPRTRHRSMHRILQQHKQRTASKRKNRPRQDV